jgi:hypothetical protein
MQLFRHCRLVNGRERPMPGRHAGQHRGAMQRTRSFILAVVAVIAASASGHAQTQDPIPRPLSVAKALYFQNNLEAWSQFLAQLPRPPTARPQATAQSVSPSFGGTWTAVTAAPSNQLCNPLLLTDGTVLVHECGTESWYVLRPDNFGNYSSGSWSATGSLPSGYGPRYQASAVLPDGRVIIQGGEYNETCNNGQTPVWTSLGAIYDPAAGTWTSVSPPSGSGWINTDACGTKHTNGGVGDAPSIVLPDGVFMLGSCCARPSLEALFNAATLTYSATGAPPTSQNEQGYTLLQTGNVLTIDVHDPNATHLYNQGTGAWTAGASTPVSLVDPCGTEEIGPAITRPDGTTVAFGGNTGCTSPPADPTAIYTASNDSWIQGPDVPQISGSYYTLADAPAAILPNGNILFAASPGFNQSPSHFFEFTSATSSPANSINQVSDPILNASALPAFVYNFLVLPNGQILVTDNSNTAEVYTPAGSPNPAWAPTISSVPTTLSLGNSYQVNGTQLNGLSQGVAYGDDEQSATNYPLVQIVNNSTGHVFYAATSNFSTMSIAPGQTASASFLVASGTETGASSLYVIANGIASQAVPVTIVSGTALTVSVTGSGTVASSPSGINCPSTCGAGFASGTPVTLTATPASGWIFSGWGGACSGSAGCTVTMNSPQSVSATFTQLFTLSATVSGSGSVTSSPAGVTCPSTCNASFPAGTPVTLTATPASGWGFAGWSGACSGFGSCMVTMNAAQSVSATFAQSLYTLNVGVSGNGSVTSSPAGINCGSVCTMNYASGTAVTLTATPTGGATFNRWGGACTGNGVCLVTMNSLENVTAIFSASAPSPSARTWVSAALGNDANPCTRNAPCLTFAAALAQTTAGGEIDVLDPGDFGPVTISQAVSIYADELGATGIMTSPGTSGIVINAGANDTVNLRGLIFDGANASGTSGVVFNSGAHLHIQNCVFRGFAMSGITFSPGVGSASIAKMAIRGATIINNAAGILVKPSGGIAADVSLDGVNIDSNNGGGLRIDGTGGTGAIDAAIADSSVSFNASNGINAVSGPGNVTVDIMRVVIAANALSGLQANQGKGGIANVTAGSAVIYGNNVALEALGGASLLTYSNNHVTGNVTNGSGFTGGATLQ